MNYELLQHYLAGDERNGQKNHLRTVRNHLKESKKASGTDQEGKLTKKQEVKILLKWIDENDLWFSGYDKNNYFAEVQNKKSTYL